MQIIDRFEIEVEFFEDAEFTAFTLQAGTRQVALETARAFCRASSGVRKATIKELSGDLRKWRVVPLSWYE